MLDSKIPRDVRLPKGENRHLKPKEKVLANQHLDDLIASKNGDIEASRRLLQFRPHLRDDGYWSLDLSRKNDLENVMRLLYREVNGVIEWKVIQNH